MCGRWIGGGRAFGRDRRGNVAMLWALFGGVMVGLVGLSVDFTRAQMIRAQLQNAADGAALVAERSSRLPFAEREDAAEAFLNAEMGPLANSVTMSVTESADGGHRVDARMPTPLTLARLVNTRNWQVRVSAEAQASVSPPIEVALVLDNTGSMSNDMDSLRSAATDLANTLFNFAVLPDDIKVSLVPFVAQVNIGNSQAHMAWMDTAGTNPLHGEWFEDREILRRDTSDGTRSGDCAGANYPTTLNGYTVTWVRSGSRCVAYQGYGSDVNVFTLYANLPASAAWQGCVEARPAPYDISDAAPDPSVPATMFVPYFWPDEGGDDSHSNNWLTENQSNILSLPGNSSAREDVTNSQDARTLNIFKYHTGASVSITDSSPQQRGPNRGCPTPIVPLTQDRATVTTAITAMRHWNGGGTNQAEGLAWGWRVLSPGAPFTEGRAYDDPNDPVHKVLVLMTDGENTSLRNDNNAFLSDYSSYQFRRLWQTYQSLTTPSGGAPGIPSEWRRAISSESTFVNYINAREEALCTAIKNAGIEIYTIQFRDTSDDNETRLRNCASADIAGQPRHFYSAANASELSAAFDAIGTGIGDLRLTH